MMNRVELNDEMMAQVNGGLIVVNRDNPELPKNTLPVVITNDLDPVTEYVVDFVTDPKKIARVVMPFFG